MNSVAMLDSISIKKFEQTLKFKFKDKSLLWLALTHSSAGHSGSTAQTEKQDNNERLEFLGDRVLGLAIAELLNEQFPQAAEGELARRYNRLVRKETCAIVARELELGSFLIMGEGEHESGGRDKPTILADACEAVLGAIFLDAGYEQARSTIYRLWSSQVSNSDAVPTDAKSALQEWAQSRRLFLPKYIEAKREGPDHAPSFTVEVHIAGLEPAQGSGSSKRIAEQAAAQTMLEREDIWDKKRDN